MQIISRYSPYYIIGLLFCVFLPYDLMRVVGVFSPFSFYTFFAFFVFIVLGSGFFSRRALVFSIPLMVSVFFLIVNSVFFADNPIEDLKLAIVLMFIVVTLVLTHNLLRCIGFSVFYRVVNFSFLIGAVISIFLYFYFGYGITNSGRSSSFFQTSNALAAYAVIGFAMLLVARIKEIKLGYFFIGCLVYLVVIVLSGSRGALVFYFLLIALSSVLVFGTWYRLIFTTLILVFLAFFDVFVLGLSEFFYLIAELTEIRGLGRLAYFLELIGSGSSLGDLDDSRSAISSAIIDRFLNSPFFFGHGIESSVTLTDYFIKPHNFILYSLYEIGLIPSLVFTLFFVLIIGYCIIRCFMVSGVLRGEISVLLVFGSVFFLALKTPFLLQTPIYWVLMFVVYTDAFSDESDRGFCLV